MGKLALPDLELAVRTDGTSNGLWALVMPYMLNLPFKRSLKSYSMIWIESGKIGAGHVFDISETNICSNTEQLQLNIFLQSSNQSSHGTSGRKKSI